MHGCAGHYIFRFGQLRGAVGQQVGLGQQYHRRCARVVGDRQVALQTIGIEVVVERRYYEHVVEIGGHGLLARRGAGFTPAEQRMTRQRLQYATVAGGIGIYAHEVAGGGPVLQPLAVGGA